MARKILPRKELHVEKPVAKPMDAHKEGFRTGLGVTIHPDLFDFFYSGYLKGRSALDSLDWDTLDAMGILSTLD